MFCFYICNSYKYNMFFRCVFIFKKLLKYNKMFNFICFFFCYVVYCCLIKDKLYVVWDVFLKLLFLDL